MKYFFPDSHDQVDPTFNFEKETRHELRVKQRDECYAHEIMDPTPYDGVLVSKAMVDGVGGGREGRYTMAQRHRLLRSGVRHFFRLDSARPHGKRLDSMGDCGAFSYAKEDRPPFEVDDVLDFYEECGFDYGVSIDHIIFAFQPELDQTPSEVPEEFRRRQEITLELADAFLAAHGRRKSAFTPVGAAQGWSPASYAHAVDKLQKMGYRYIGLGGMVPLKSDQILDSLKVISQVRLPDTRMHLFGVTRINHIESFSDYGVSSFDSTSPLRQAFMDEKDNYYTHDRTYVAVRVPQVEGNDRLTRRIQAGAVNQRRALELEKECLNLLKRYDRNDASVDDIMPALRQYQDLYDGKKDRTPAYEATLRAQPWKSCSCRVCHDLGIHVILFRGAERNRRRGFHNLHVFYDRLKALKLGQPTTAPATLAKAAS